MRIQPFTHFAQLTRLRFSNCYLVREDDGYTLIDTSLAGSADAILTAAHQLGATIARIVLTHAHHDHAGSLSALRTALPAAEIIVGHREARLLTGDLSLEQNEPAGRKLLSRTYIRHLRPPHRTVVGGDRIGSLEVIDTPGHTPGHICLRDVRDGTLFAGDAYLAIAGVFVCTQFRWQYPFPWLYGTWHNELSLRSARYLLDSRPTRLATGHGPVVDDPMRRMAAALESTGLATQCGRPAPNHHHYDQR